MCIRDRYIKIPVVDRYNLKLKWYTWLVNTFIFDVQHLGLLLGGTISFLSSFNVYVKSFYAMRTIGKGLSASNVLCSLIELPLHKFKECNKFLLTSVEFRTQDSVIKATREVITENSGNNHLPSNGLR